MAEGGSDGDGDVPDPAPLLEAAGFDPDEAVLTRRQAEVLALRERGFAQAAVADRIGTSRANVASVEASARRNVDRARETVSVAEALRAPVSVRVEPDADVYEVPERVYDAADEADVDVAASTPELVSAITERAGGALDGRRVAEPIVVAVTPAGELRIRRG